LRGSQTPQERGSAPARGHDFEIAHYNINTLIYRKEQLLQPLPVPAAEREK
jgi:hypothetical protein